MDALRRESPSEVIRQIGKELCARTSSGVLGPGTGSKRTGPKEKDPRWRVLLDQVPELSLTQRVTAGKQNRGSEETLVMCGDFIADFAC